MDIALGLAAVLALILANGYFVAAEFAFVAVRRARLEELAEHGEPRARRALTVLQRLSFMLSGAQLGITVTSLVVGFIAEPTVGRAIEPLVRLTGVSGDAAFGVSLTIAFVLATTFQMVIGELAPKNLAIAQPETFALALARSTAAYTAVARPFIWLFDSASNRLLRAVGIEPVEELAGGASADELAFIIGESTRGGVLDREQARLLRRALEFRTLRAVDAMVSRTHVHHLDVDATGADLRHLSVDTGHSRFPVARGDLDDVVGFVQVQDLLRVPPHERDHVPLRTMLRPVLAVPELSPLGPLLADLRASHRQLAVVVDEYGGTAGIVTLEDIVEELVGDIEDEHDPEDLVFRRLPDGSYLLPGSWRIDEVARETAITLPEGDYETVGGLVMERLGRVAEPGDQVVLDCAVVHVEAVDGHAVAVVRLAAGEVTQ